MELLRYGQIPLLAAHRGVSGGNIPCNSRAAYKAAVMQGADIIELDVSISLDKKLFAFHPFMEKAHLNLSLPIRFMFSKQVNWRCYTNQDNAATYERVLTLDDALDLLKDKCIVNIDKFWTAPKEISRCIRQHNMENQIIIKTPASEKHFSAVEELAADFAFMPIVKKADNVSKELMKRKLNFMGIEAVFSDESDPVISDEHIEWLHKNSLAIWGNAIVYNKKDIISAGHTDDIALTENPDYGWGWFYDKKFDIIQTDWLTQAKNYFDTRLRNHN